MSQSLYWYLLVLQLRSIFISLNKHIFEIYILNMKMLPTVNIKYSLIIDCKNWHWYLFGITFLCDELLHNGIRLKLSLPRTTVTLILKSLAISHPKWGSKRQTTFEQTNIALFHYFSSGFHECSDGIWCDVLYMLCIKRNHVYDISVILANVLS